MVGVIDEYDPKIQMPLIARMEALMASGTRYVIFVEGLHVCGCFWRW